MSLFSCFRRLFSASSSPSPFHTSPPPPPESDDDNMNSSQPPSRRQRRGGRKAPKNTEKTHVLGVMGSINGSKQNVTAKDGDMKEVKHTQIRNEKQENRAFGPSTALGTASGPRSLNKSSTQALPTKPAESAATSEAVKLGTAIVGDLKVGSKINQAAEEGIADAKMKQGQVTIDTVGTTNQPEFMEILEQQLEAIAIDNDEKAIHEGFMREALGMAELALKSDETPVGCVFVHDGKIIARGMNATNHTLNGTRHAEFMAISYIISPPPWSDAKAYPPSVLRETDLYVTVEPCIMCASLLRQYGIRKVYFGASNDKFGGTGGVLNIHADIDIGGEPGYPVSGGWLREEAILALRKFYVQENEKAPEPRNKKERKLKTEVQPYQKPATPALTKTRNSRFNSRPGTSGSSASTQTSTQASTEPGTPAG